MNLIRLSCFCILILHLFWVKSHASPISLRHTIPALYVFGDSVVDSGNNNHLPTMARANFQPYGIDLNGKPTGRFTNGRTIVDFIAEMVGLPLPPPYLGMSKLERMTTNTGVNYASGSCGILPSTGKVDGTCLSFDEQINFFQNTLKNLRRQINNSGRLTQHLRKSLFFICIGSNDLMLNYANPNSNLSRKFTPQAFGIFLSKQLSLRLQRLYRLGARKFVVSNIGRIGCIPALINSLKPVTPCVEQLNRLASMYNMQLPALVRRLQSTLPGSKFVLEDAYRLALDIEARPSAYGIKEMRKGCCIDAGGDGTQLCAMNKTPCKDRDRHFFFDSIHPTQAVHLLSLRRCFHDYSICTPITLEQLLLA